MLGEDEKWIQEITFQI